MLTKHLHLGEIVDVPTLDGIVPEGSLAIIGGPVSCFHTRFIMGWNGPSQLLGIDLPIRFGCTSSLSGAAEIEPWHVIVEGRASDNECLVITSLPLGYFGERLTIFAGLHHAGMRAINLVLDDRQLMDALGRKTHKLPAWQAIVEVKAVGFDPKALGHLRVLEISGVNFDDPNLKIREKLVFDERIVADLDRLLPHHGEPDYSDPAMTNITNLNTYKLHKLQSQSMLGKGPAIAARDSLTTLGEPRDRTEGRPAKRHLQRKEDQLNVFRNAKRVAAESPKRMGRPRKEKSDAVLTQRLTVMMSPEEMEMVAVMQRLTGARSIGQVVRDALMNENERLKSKKRLLS